MNLVDKKVIHKTFGKGNVVKYDDSYIKIGFESGVKKFIFPDVFAKYVTFVDQKATHLVGKKIEIRREEQRKEAIILEKERAIEQEQQRILIQERQMQGRKIHPELQSVFWCKEQEEDEIFTEGKIFIGRMKSGKNKGQPRRLPRMNRRSACLLTRREADVLEEDRQILGVFMAEETFNGRSSTDGYIPAHPKYRIRLSEEETKKMYFWNYYFNKRTPTEMIWNSGRQRYFDNEWMAQILRDIVALRENTEEGKEAKLFFEHFCQINRIKIDELPKPNGALVQV